MLEQGTVELLRDLRVAERMDREGLLHTGLDLRFDGQSHCIPLTELSGGRSIMVYGQQEVVKDRIQARLAAGGQILFEAQATGLFDRRQTLLPDATDSTGFQLESYSATCLRHVHWRITMSVSNASRIQHDQSRRFGRVR